jgi:hypothetical protein
VPLTSQSRTTDGKLPAGTGLNNAAAFDTTDLGCLRPFSLAHVHFGVINPECLYFNDNVPWLRLRLGHFLDHQTVQTGAKVIYNDGSHVNSPSSFNRFLFESRSRTFPQPLTGRSRLRHTPQCGGVVGR